MRVRGSAPAAARQARQDRCAWPRSARDNARSERSSGPTRAAPDAPRAAGPSPIYGRSITYIRQVHHLYMVASLEQVMDLTQSRLQPYVIQAAPPQASPIQAAAYIHHLYKGTFITYIRQVHHLLAVEVQHIEYLEHEMAPRVGSAVAGGRALVRVGVRGLRG